MAPFSELSASAATTRERPLKLALLQTQSEAAGAQEISRILGLGLEQKGFQVEHLFLFRRTAAFDHYPNVYYCASERPRGIVSLSRLFIALVRRLKFTSPDAVVCFQHYGNIVGALAGRIAGIDVIVANRTSSNSLVPRWAQWIDLVFGCIGLLLTAGAASDAFAWGAAHGAYGGAAFRGPGGGAAVRGPGGNWAARGPGGNVAYGHSYGGYHGGTYYHGGAYYGGYHGAYYGGGAFAAGAVTGAAVGAAAASAAAAPYYYTSPYYYPPAY